MISLRRLLPSTIPSGLYGFFAQNALSIAALSLACNASERSLYASNRAMETLPGGKTLAAALAASQPG